MERLAPAWRDPVDIDPYQDRIHGSGEIGAGFFDDFAPRRVPDFGVLRFDMTAGKKPSFQAVMKHDQERVTRRMQNESGGCDVSWNELRPGKWRGGVGEKLED